MPRTIASSSSGNAASSSINSGPSGTFFEFSVKQGKEGRSGYARKAKEARDEKEKRREIREGKRRACSVGVHNVSEEHTPRKRIYSQGTIIGATTDNSSSHLQSPFSSEETAEQRKTCANHVLESLLANKNPSKTLLQYKTYLKAWQVFCSTREKADCSVDARKMLKFFEEVVFKRTVKKYIDSNAGFSGVVGKASSQAARSVLEGKLTRENKRKPKAWKAETEESIFQDVVHELEQNYSQRNSQPYETPAFEGFEEASQGDKDDAGSEDEEQNHSQPAEEEALMSAEPQALMVSSIAERAKILSHPQTDETGRRFIYAPISIETVDCARKALIYLYKEQASSKVDWPNPAPHPRKDIPLKEAIEEYEGKLVYDTSFQGSTRTDTCSIRDPYNEKQFIRMALHTWGMKPMLRLKGKRVYHAEGRFQYMRERLCILARHHMLLRDEDIRNLNLSDVFSIMSSHPASGSQPALGLTFCISRGKTNKKGVKLYATAFRHKVFYRCTVGAFGFYMLERFMLDKEDVPNFADPDDWYNIKLLVAASTIEKRNAGLRKNAVAPKTQIDATASVMRTCGVYSTKVTHAGRHAGTSDAYRLGLGLEHIRHLGRWVMGQMESFYAPKNPTTGAFYMAHFNKEQEPYILERNLVIPDLELQRKIFPWIEGNFNSSARENEEWVKDCNDAMTDVNPDLITEDDLHWGGWQERMRHSTAARDQDEETTGSSAATANKLMNSAMIDRRAFLLLLVQMRRVILQDAVLYLKPDSKGRTLSNKLLESLPEIFESQLFLDFQRELLRAIEVHQQSANVVNPLVPVDKHVVSNALNSLSHQNASLEAAIARQGAQMAQQEAQQRAQLSAMSSELATLKQQMEIVIHLLQDPSARQAPAHPLNSAGLLGPYPHTMPSYPALRRVPQQQPFATRPPQVPQQHSSLVQAPLHCFQRAPEPSHHSSPGPSSSSATFKWKADRGKLTVADAWDEFHGPLAAFKRLNPSWPVNTSDQRAYNRRYELIRLINEAARREGRNPEDIVAEWSQANEGKTINSLLISMKAREQEDPEDDQ